MYLKAIELHGFKSFPEKTKIEFEKGMSAVVGPNGSGKSNISDAIRWVLGETRTSRLRANGKMEDIIFGGTQKRNPMGFASVSLVLDNSDRTFDVENDEVTVMRKYYRGGDSEYYINGARVRLHDIQELFMDTGLGKNGYSVVGQGKINEIVMSKPEQRREIFEEASGIAKFRYKKNEAERKLDSAQDNIIRLTDILTELSERVEPLEKESEKAKKFIELSESKKSMEISLWIDTIDKSNEIIRSHQRKLEIFQDDYNRLEDKLNNIEKSIEEKFLYSNSLISKSEENVENIRKADSEISQILSNKAADEQAKKYEQNECEKIKNEISEFENQSEKSNTQKELYEKEINEYKKIISEKEKEKFNLQKKLDEVTAFSHINGDEKVKINGDLSNANIILQENKIELGSIDSKAETIKDNLISLKENLTKAEQYLFSTDEQSKDVGDFISLTDENIIKNNNIKKGLEIKKSSAEQRYNKSNENINSLLSEKNHIEQRVKILTELENNMDGFSHSVKAVLQKGKENRLNGILGSVAQVIDVKEGYETAIETALGYSLQNIVVENETSAKRAIEFLKNSKIGRATFLPLDTVKPSNFNERLPEWATTADSLIEADARYSNIISNLLGRIIIVKDINSASSLAKKLNYRYKIVTMDGQQINAGGSFTGGSVSKSAGLFTRKTEIETLKNKIVKIDEQFETLEKEKVLAKEALDKINSTIEGCEAEIASFESDKNEAKIELARLEQMKSQYSNNISNISRDIETAESIVSGSESREKELNDNIKELENKISQYNEKLKKLGTQDEESIQLQNKLAVDVQAIELETVQLNSKVDIVENSLKILFSDMNSREEKKKSLFLRLDETKEKINELEKSISSADENVKQLKNIVLEKEEENKNIVKERLEIEAERNKISADGKSISEEKESLSVQITKMTEKISNLEIEYDSIILQLWEEYELTVETARPFACEVLDEALVKRNLIATKTAIKKLGSVNVGAIEEYKDVFERYTYLKGQLEDLLQSKNQLTNLISSLSSEMKTLFINSFDDINTQFGNIFAELFGGGSAKLELTDMEDVLNSGIEITVAPPGKVIKSLTALSGGEQALVAIAIYFAILAHNPSPFCVLDEIEAALDDVNVARYANYLHRICDKTQFIVITHRRGTMEEADVLYGVTMQEDGISKLLKLDVNNLSPSILN